ALMGSFIIDNIILKNLVARTRPYEVVQGLQLLIGKQNDFSFPSGHTGSSFASAVILYKELPKKYGIPLIGLATLIGFSRLYLAVHYPSDVLGGAIIGTLIAILVNKVYYLLFDNSGK
ncbi:MAG: phosphatase PAP2 family protein, partial [Massilibacteroides sp.]|nr:phosphatase PAP2 family protein [Massilibacteroides sp.]